MIYNTLAQISAFTILTLTSHLGYSIAPDHMLASHEFSLEKRYYPVQKENILLNLAYMDGKVSKKEDINWDEIQKPQTYAFMLNPGETFAFHDDVLPEYSDKVVKTTNAHFNYAEGFKSYGYLVGDGVCHLASLIYLVALDAGLDAKAPTRHDFMSIPEIDRQYGVSIFNNPNLPGANAKQNLYITNNRDKTVEFKFDYNGDKLKISVVEIN